MSSSLRRGAIAATAIAVSFGSLSACSAGNDAETLKIKPDNAATSAGDLKLQNVAIVTPAERESTGAASVTGKIFNNGDTAQTLESISLPGTDARVQLSPAKGSGPVTVPAGGSVQLGGEGNASAKIEGGREAARDGDAQRISFRFSKQGEVAIEAFVVPATNYYKDFGPSEAPAAEASATESGSPSATASPSDTGTGEADAGEAGAEASATESGAGDDAEHEAAGH
ncbi:copper chaperone PCu(A)C [Streptomyces sp. GC420]|uniref:copper chaperone PCu(A)C n=1 Tax=Streptomyces sp. GC420 TaxID=2697568 RepID=UPI0014152B25|nr:copper chaperone PCu(A)C [Streptomyces sp. GC420]NBM18419.1 DUF461 domain-containing protein [Streptomyces sp. GC420]